MAWCSGVAMLWIIVSALLLPRSTRREAYEGILSEVMSHIHHIPIFVHNGDH